MDRMSATDAGFYYAEGERTPMHVGSVTVFEGPAPSYGDVVRLLMGKLGHVPRYRQRVRTVPLNLGRPVWVDDPHFQILYHVRHTAVPAPGSAEQLRNLAGRVLGQRLDMTKPLWELWLVEGLANGRWAMINKVHHAMVDGIAGTDLMQLIFDVDPDAEHPAPATWTALQPPSTPSLVARSLTETVLHPVRQAATLPRYVTRLANPADLAGRGAVLAGALATTGRQALTPVASTLNGSIGPHRRWAWAETTVDDVTHVRRVLGGSMNDVVLAGIAAGFRDLLGKRGELRDGRVVRTMVPVSVRRETERGSLNNQVTAVYVDLPVTEPDPVARLRAIQAQMNAHKTVLASYDPRVAIGAADLIAAPLFAVGVRALLRANQPWVQAVTTNVPGPRIPLYVLGRRMESLYAHVPIAAGLRTAIGIFSYLRTITFGINADFDAVPDVEVLSSGIAQGIRELVDRAEAAAEPAAASPQRNGRRSPARAARAAARSRPASR